MLFGAPNSGVPTAMSTIEMRRLVLRNELAELERLASWIENAVTENVSSDMSLAIQVCLEEVVANVIMYGAAKEERLEITVELDRAAGTLVARIEDNGREFDPTQVPPPTVATSLAEAKAGNLGINVTRSFSDGMDYERRDGRNRLMLRFIEAPPTS
jgi:anti-sigma regulatory factor (Ser/Thr protein kinase)